MSITSRVAEELNLDASTVSRALNNRYGVSEKTRKRVIAHVEAMVSDGTFKGLRRSSRKQCRTIGVVLPDVGGDFFGRFLSGVESSVSAQRGLVTISQSKYDRLRELQILEHLVEQDVDGIILVTVDDSGDWRPPRQIADGSIPVVLADRAIPGRRMPAVLWADRQGEREAADLILNLGHRNLAFIAPPFSFNATAERIDGIREAMSARGIAQESLRIYQSAATDSRSAIIRCMHDSPRPTTIFLNDDDMAPGAYRVLHDFGLKPGVDVAVMGFGDQAVASQLHVPLTTLRQDMVMMGRKCVEMIIDRIEQPSMEVRQMVLPVPLVLRESCGAARAASASVEAIRVH
jgi:DNA-binding LacI/PurR family transcriptional regulator